MADVLLKPAGLNDLDWILALEARLRETGTLLGDSYEKHAAQIADPECRYLLAHAAGETAGFILFRDIKSSNRSVQLKRLAVSTPGQGLGQPLLCQAIAYAFRELNAHRLWLDTLTDNARAQHIYRKFGFMEEGRLREVVERDGVRVDMIRFSLLACEFSANGQA